MLLARALRLARPDVLNPHIPSAGELALEVAGGQVAVVLHVHSLVPLDRAGGVLQAAHRVVVMNPSVRDWVARVPGVAAKTVESVLPVDAARFRPRPRPDREGFRVLYCGRLSRRKATVVECMGAMWGELSADMPGLELTVVGRGRIREARAWAAEANRAAGRRGVRVIGQLADPAEGIAGADVVLGTGYVALEALACGVHTVGVGIQGLTGLVTEASFDAAAALNFGDHGALEEMTPEGLVRELSRAHAAWRESPRVEWSPALIQRRHSPERVAQDLEAAFA
jgi:glycosyltransferase involved in cell wall biosynthesis